MKLIDNWKQCLKFWSIRLGLLGSAVAGAFLASPDAALYAWNIMPAELRDAIPERFMPLLGVGIFVLSMVARVVKQERLSSVEKKTEDEPPAE